MSKQQMPKTDDEALSALLDGALDEESARTLHARLAEEPALAARLDALRDADARVCEAYAGIASEPLPPAVLDRLRAPAVRENVLPFARRAYRPALSAHLPWAAAAAVALAIGWLAGSLRSGDADPVLAVAGVVAPDSGLNALLEETPSGVTHDLPGNLSGTARLTYRNTLGEYCRQIVLTAREGRTEALACRGQDAVWRIELAEFTADDGALYRPAAGGSMIGAAVDESISGAPLEAQQEQALIEQDWAQ